MGLTLRDLDELDAGTVMDMIIESGNDSFDYSKEDTIRKATQADFDNF